MAKPVKVIRSIFKRVGIREDYVAQVDLHLYSDFEGKVPFGAWQKYLEGLIGADLLARKTQQQKLTTQEPQK